MPRVCSWGGSRDSAGPHLSLAPRGRRSGEHPRRRDATSGMSAHYFWDDTAAAGPGGADRGDVRRDRAQLRPVRRAVLRHHRGRAGGPAGSAAGRAGPRRGGRPRRGHRAGGRGGRSAGAGGRDRRLPGMVGLLSAATRHLPQVRVAAGDATDPRLDGVSYDLVAASLVLFFLPDPVRALRRWAGLLEPGGRVGAATFRPWPSTGSRSRTSSTSTPSRRRGPAPPPCPRCTPRTRASRASSGPPGSPTCGPSGDLRDPLRRPRAVAGLVAGDGHARTVDAHPGGVARGDPHPGRPGPGGIGGAMDVSIRYTLGVAPSR
ncbi:class I SAM-dependent methyltransferase [Nocardioides ungokensis]|uniref:class I SAM-dependent methyltransferase n=1 Tax=Nocardioides ungokensis TaxID=1643322 RepID=UPI003CCE4B7C